MKSEKLNLEKAKEILNNLFRGWLGSIQIQDDYIESTSGIIAKAYDNDIIVHLCFDCEGDGGILFCFGNIDKDEQTLDFVNTFNYEVSRLKAVIMSADDESGYVLNVFHKVYYCTTDTIAQIVHDAFDDLEDEYTVKYLKPLTELTRPVHGIVKFEKLNLERTKEVLDNLFKDWLDISIQIKEGCLKGETTFTAKAYDDDIRIHLSFTWQGNGGIFFYFGNIDKNERTLNLVNTFNDEVFGLEAVITCYGDGECGLEVFHEVEYRTVDTICQTVQEVFDKLTDKDTVKYLKPLTNLTY